MRQQPRPVGSSLPCSPDGTSSSADYLTRPYLQVSVNEAAAQICRLVPAMLTRRDELFPLARQVVRDSGYQYSKGHSRYSIFVLMPALHFFASFGDPDSLGSILFCWIPDPHLALIDPYPI